MSKRHPLILMAPFFLSQSKAEQHVKTLLKKMGAVRPPQGWHSSDYTFKTPKGEIHLVWKDMVKEARDTGRVATIQNWIDSMDPFFGGSYGMAVSSSNMSIGTEFLGVQRKFKGPARNYPVEQELVGDILEYRRLCSASSLPGSFEETTRYFRSYLFASVSLIDAFINRHVHIALFQGRTDPEFGELMKPGRLEDRLALWLSAFGRRGNADLKNGKKWNDLSTLRQARNQTIHAIEPYYGYEIKSLVGPLNACREGVGGMILFLQQEAGHPATSLFELLAIAPVVRFSEKG